MSAARKPAISYAHRGGKQHIVSPTFPTRTTCGVNLAVGREWVIQDKPQRTLCASCERMRASALVELEGVRTNQSRKAK